ncbi:MAG TPA: hypothetical protein PLM07_10960 [Candidatus Rifleibacterium sp.]|nr:hypothetical protein [Candidatus Rifleibacterium sp.]HPT46412.1 hypothetical protein [Candidatus Rifleibacterium sp.]
MKTTKTSQPKSYSYGRLLLEYLPADPRQKTMLLASLYDTCESLVKAVVKRLGLENVVEESQLEATIDHLIREVTTEPADIKALKNNHSVSSLRHSEFLREKIRETLMLQNATTLPKAEIEARIELHLAQLRLYSCRRIRTLLKEHAAGQSRAYILFNNRTRSNLKKLLDAEPDALFLHKPDFWSASPQPAAFIDDIKNLSSLNAPINGTEFSTAREKYKTTLAMFLTLPDHKNQAFSLRAISEFFFEREAGNNFITAPAKATPSLHGDDSDDTTTHEIVVDEPGFELAAGTIDAEAPFSVLTRSYNSDDQLVQQVQMAGLAFMAYEDFHGNQAFFPESLLSQSQLAMGLTDCVKDFLNDNRFAHLKWKSPERGTANNRLQTFKNAVANSMADLSLFARRQFIQKLGDYLLGRFNSMIEGEKK